MSRSKSLFSDFEIKPSRRFSEPMIWVRRLVFIESPRAPVKIIRRISFRRGLNIICTEARTPQDTSPVGHSVGKSLLVRIIRYCLGEDRYCTESLRKAITLQLERGYVMAVVRVNGVDWTVARPLGLETGYADSWCVRTKSLRVALSESPRVKYREFLDAVESATRSCYTTLDLPQAKRPAVWRDLLGWLSRDQDCHFDHHAQWRALELQAGPRVLTREDSYYVMRMALGLLGRDEMDLIEQHRKLLVAKSEVEDRIQQYTIHINQVERQLRQTVSELAEQVPGAVFGSAYMNVANEKIAMLQRLLDSEAQKYEPQLQDLANKREQHLRTEGRLVAELEELENQRQIAVQELEQIQKLDDAACIKAMCDQRWKCGYYTDKKIAIQAGCPGEKQIDQSMSDPWRRDKIVEYTEILKAIALRKHDCQTAVDDCHQELNAICTQYGKIDQAYQTIREGVFDQIGQWKNRKTEAESYLAIWREITTLENGRDARQKNIEDSTVKLRTARDQNKRQIADLSDYYDAVLKQTISPDATGKIESDGDGLRPRSNAVVADSGTTIRQYADVLGFDLACLTASICGVGHLPRFWIHDSPRQADSEEQLYHSVLKLISNLEASYPKSCPVAFQYILTTTSVPPDEVNRPPYVRARLHARIANGKLLKCDFGK